jgi:hypothetical protein
MPSFRTKRKNKFNMHNSTAMFLQKNLAGFEPGSSIPFADAVITAPRIRMLSPETRFFRKALFNEKLALPNLTDCLGQIG